MWIPSSSGYSESLMRCKTVTGCSQIHEPSQNWLSNPALSSKIFRATHKTTCVCFNPDQPRPAQPSFNFSGSGVHRGVSPAELTGVTQGPFWLGPSPPDLMFLQWHYSWHLSTQGGAEDCNYFIYIIFVYVCIIILLHILWLHLWSRSKYELLSCWTNCKYFHELVF